MQLSWEAIQQNAVAFSKRWKGIAGRERQQAQAFVREFLAVFGIDDPVERVRDWRANSKRQNTILLADTPMLFAEIRQPNEMHLAIPTVSS